MKRILLFLAPIVLGLLVFFVFISFFVTSKGGNGALQITAAPVSTVFVNGTAMGKTPLCLCEGKQMLAVGSYTVKLVPLAGDNLLPYEENITITKGTLTVVDRTFGVGEFSTGSVISLVPAASTQVTQLFVASFPSGASMQLDGNPAGITPLLIKSLTSSDHDVLLTKPGYSDKTVHIHTVAGYQLKAFITLSIQQPTNATDAANFQNASLTQTQPEAGGPLVKKIIILDTPTGFLRVRSDPSLSASETAQVKPGDSFPFVSEQDGWYQIKLANGTSGWVNTQYAKKNQQ